MGPDHRVRIYTPFFPFPLTEGAFFVIYDQARVLASMGWDVELVTWKDPPAEISRKLQAPYSCSFHPDLRITYLPEAGLQRLTAGEWLDRMAETADAAPRESAFSRALRVCRSLTSPFASPELFHYPPSWDRRERLPAAEIGIYHYSFAYSWMSAGAAPPERRIFVHMHNLESVLAEIRIGNSDSWTFGASWVHRLNAGKLERHERALAHQVDELWFLSPVDLERYRCESSGCDVRLVPPTISPRLRQRRRRAFHERRASKGQVRAGFLGGGCFEPNRVSMEWIVDRLAPELHRRRFGGTIVMAGRAVPEALRHRAQRYDFFEWPGFVPDLEPFWSGLSFFLIPHVRGSGVRIKLLEALVSGVPVLTNEAAVDALAPGLRDHPLLVVSEDPGVWAERIASERTPFRTREGRELPEIEASGLAGPEVYDFLGQPPRQ